MHSDRGLLLQANPAVSLLLFISVFVTPHGPQQEASSSGALLDLRTARIVTAPNASKVERNAAALLIDEVEKRTQIRLQSTTQWPSDSTPVLAIGTRASLNSFAGPYAADLSLESGPSGSEGFRIRVRKDRAVPAVLVVGNDSRGVLFGVGRLLRSLRMSRGRLQFPESLQVSTAPKYPLRGHQLGYRPKTNSYDGWTPALWEQYIRDLAVFGTNAVELIPPRSDDASDSPHFPLPQIEMMRRMSQMLDDYGLDVWIWYPAMDKDYTDPKTVESALEEWRGVFQKLPRIDAVFVPGGDPGHTRPSVLLALLERQTHNLRRYHPRAEMWISPQSFSQEWMEEFLEILRKDQPGWLRGVVFGPQVRMSLAALRTAVPPKYPIRHYPDITHSRQCQYPVPDWDPAYAITEAREVINPRPLGQARIFRLLQPHTIGFLAYSEGCNDDVNKIVWSALGWDPATDVLEILRQYSRYFIGEHFDEAFAQGLLALEANWNGPLLTNGNVQTTLEQFRSLEKAASPGDLANWRFQQALYRAHYDAYTRARLIHEIAQEERALDSLREAGQIGSLSAMARAEELLDQASRPSIALDRRARVFELAEALFQSIRMQHSVERYKAISVGRGANLDTIDMPLNSRLWLKARFRELRAAASEQERLDGVRRILDWTNPGPGGFYDDLGNTARQPHLVRGPGFDSDPAHLDSALLSFTYHADLPYSSWNYAESLNDSPLRMEYSGLDPRSKYKVRVVYAGDALSVPIRLVADDSVEIHPLIKKESPIRPVEFDIPPETTADGRLRLSWNRPPGLGGNGRGCQVSEVWLIRK